MKKILLLNFDIGSGVEYVGNVIAEWIKEFDVEFLEYKVQNPACLVIDSFLKFKPDVVIINDRSARLYEPSYYYKRFFPETKSIYISHGIKEIAQPSSTGNNERREDEVLFYIFARDYMDTIISLGDPIQAPDFIRSRLLKGCFPVYPNDYRPKIQWSHRKKNFCYIGQINKLKFSEDFIRLLKDSPDIDLYGNVNENGFLEKDCVNIIKNYKGYFGQQPQETISDILNQYKYFVLPHGRMPEIFNITLQQAINCGTIPLLLNDQTSDFDHTWAQWASEFVIQFDKEEHLLSAMKELSKNQNDYTYMSYNISAKIQEKFSYWKFKNDFNKLMKGHLDEI